MTLEPATINILIGSGISLLGVIIANGLLIWRDRLQWQKQQELEHKRWERDKLLEIYHKCISSITDYLQSKRSVTFDPTQSPVSSALPYNRGGIVYDSKLYAQAQAWLKLLLIYYPAKETQEYIDFENEVEALEQTPEKLTQLLERVVALAKSFSVQERKDSL